MMFQIVSLDLPMPAFPVTSRTRVGRAPASPVRGWARGWGDSRPPQKRPIAGAVLRKSNLLTVGPSKTSGTLGRKCVRHQMTSPMLC